MSKVRARGFFSVDTCFQLGIWVNVALALFKFFAGVFGNSHALIADAIHSTSDVVATAVVWIAYKSSKKPADANHPYGHEGIESLAAIFVSILLMITGGYMVYSVIKLIIVGTYREPTILALDAAAVSVVIKEAMYHYTAWIGKRENSPALISNAWDHRSDAFSSVAALLGIIGARVGSDFFDPVAGIVIALLIIHMAYKIMRENVGMLIDEPPKPELFNKLKGVIHGVEGVRDLGDFKVRRRGSMYYIDLTIYVCGGLTVSEGHAIAEKVEKQLLASGNRIFSSMVHVEPTSCSDG
jgi:cation diffusion facilitator family transporter